MGSDAYVPSRKIWETISPEKAGVNAAGMKEAIQFHHENSAANEPSDREKLAMVEGQTEVDAPPYDRFDDLLGPIRHRGPENGIILRHGYIVAEWGNTQQIDMTYSVAKSYIAAMAGIAIDRGYIEDIDDPVREYCLEELFHDPHNSQVTWRQLLQQTSEWKGVLWEKPDWSDHEGLPVGRRHERKLVTPGTHHEYNDVRVNLLALALTNVIRQPLAQTLLQEVMDPVGASRTWRWHGYENSWVEIDGQPMQIVSGGSHWGGGIWMHSRDHARFGLLHLREGNWNGHQVLSKEWVKEATTPCDVCAHYGYLWWLNTDRELLPNASSSAFMARGGGQNMIYVDPASDIVVVFRWLKNDAIDGFLERIHAAIK